MIGRLTVIFFLFMFLQGYGQEFKRLGKELFEQHCNQCHPKKTTKTTDNFSLKAPPIDVIVHQARYYYRNKEDFIEYLTDYLKEPSVEKSICKPCIERWGLMPKQNLTEEDIQLIGNWLFSTFR